VVVFADRRDAGRALAQRLLTLELRDPVVLALPRGGVPVAYEVARGLDAALDVFVVRKVGAPQQPEYGVGAVAEGGSQVIDQRAVRALRIADDDLSRLIAHEQAEVERRVREYRGDRTLPVLRDRDVVLCDDGLATGVTAEAALRALRASSPRRLVLAAPVCAPDTADRLRALCDDVVCVDAPASFRAVGVFYDDFTQTTDDEVRRLLSSAEG
jgi:putative phosphoribosyl transferase